MFVPFVNLGLQYKQLRGKILKKFDNLSLKGNYILGEELERFETEFAEYCNVNYAVGLGNGSDGLSFALMYYNISRGDEVILPVNSFVASAWTIANTGAKPKFVDVRDDFNINPKLIKQAINSKTKAIMPVHLTGKVADMLEIKKIAKKNNLLIIEDAAQAVGATYKKNKAGSFGNIASFSMHPLKNLHVHGDGGVITTNNKKIYEFMKKIRNHGLKSRDKLDFWGYNSRLDNINAAIARIKLKHLDKWNNRFRKIAEFYSKQLSPYLRVPIHDHHHKPTYHRYIIKFKGRNNLMKYLKNKGVETRVNYPIPLHMHKPSKLQFNYKKGDYPIAEKQSKEILSLPIYNELTDAQVEYVVDSIKSFFS